MGNQILAETETGSSCRMEAHYSYSDEHKRGLKKTITAYLGKNTCVLANACVLIKHIRTTHVILLADPVSKTVNIATWTEKLLYLVDHASIGYIVFMLKE